jgi:hypothetical protein
VLTTLFAWLIMSMLVGAFLATVLDVRTTPMTAQTLGLLIGLPVSFVCYWWSVGRFIAPNDVSMSKLVTVASLDRRTEAETVKLFLENQGVDVYLVDDSLAWFASNARAVRIQVLQPQAERLVDEFRQRKSHDTQEANLPDITFDCDECGQTLSYSANRRGGVETCPNCGDYVDVPDSSSPNQGA